LIDLDVDAQANDPQDPSQPFIDVDVDGEVNDPR
jgi:hypothetical protein